MILRSAARLPTPTVCSIFLPLVLLFLFKLVDSKQYQTSEQITVGNSKNSNTQNIGHVVVPSEHRAKPLTSSVDFRANTISLLDEYLTKERPAEVGSSGSIVVVKATDLSRDERDSLTKSDTLIYSSTLNDDNKKTRADYDTDDDESSGFIESEVRFNDNGKTSKEAFLDDDKSESANQETDRSTLNTLKIDQENSQSSTGTAENDTRLQTTTKNQYISMVSVKPGGSSKQLNNRDETSYPATEEQTIQTKASETIAGFEDLEKVDINRRVEATTTTTTTTTTARNNSNELVYLNTTIVESYGKVTVPKTKESSYETELVKIIDRIKPVSKKNDSESDLLAYSAILKRSSISCKLGFFIFIF
jgi:hypothetical protein